MRFLQITMEMMAHDQKTIESVQKNMPLIRNNLLLLMSNRNYQIADVARRQGKAAAGSARRRSARCRRKQGGGDVDDLLFTSFVVQ